LNFFLFFLLIFLKNQKIVTCQDVTVPRGSDSDTC